MSDDLSAGLEFLDELGMEEQRAFLGLFAGARFPWKSFNNGPPFIGKAECGWVDDWRDFYGKRLKEAALFRFEEGLPKPALGMAPGSTFTEIDCGPTDLGWRVRDAHWDRWQARVNARAAEARL